MAVLDQIRLPMSGMDAFESSRRNELQNRLIGAQAQREQSRANLPFGGVIPPGAAGQTVGLEMMRMMYGENSPQYKQAKELYDLNKESTQARIGYQNILSGTAPKRFSTNIGKTFHEMEDIEKGNLPGTNIPLNPEQQQDLRNKYGLNLLKMTTDPKTRERVQFAENMEKTLKTIDPEALTSYSGAKGVAELGKDASMSAFGSPSEKYTKYTDAVTSATTLAKQIRQFYGDSVQADVRKGLEKLSNPSTWYKDPKVALSNFNHFVKILRSEAETFKESLKSPEIYGSKGKSVKTPEKNIESVEPEGNEGVKIEKTKQIGSDTYVFFDNAWHKQKR